MMYNLLLSMLRDNVGERERVNWEFCDEKISFGFVYVFGSAIRRRSKLSSSTPLPSHLPHGNL